MTQPEGLNVVALISGGKDSFFSILHCQKNGHNVVALANLHPPEPETKVATTAAVVPDSSDRGGIEEQTPETSDGNVLPQEEEDFEEDLNSFMYQTVGHAVIPLYADALGLPLYRQAITGGALSTSASYSANGTRDDEVEDLVPLLQKVKAHHPEVNAVACGAILSTYQRTRVESVVLRLGLIPLAYLWQYPTLPDCEGTALLRDMRNAGLQPRIVKVASAGLDDSFLWEELVSFRGEARVEKAMKRFGEASDGAVLGEGGEFETIVVDGPAAVFKGRIEVKEGDRVVVREGGGAAWVNIRNAKVVMKEDQEMTTSDLIVRVPDLLETEFEACLRTMSDLDDLEGQLRQMSLQPDSEDITPTMKDYPSADNSRSIKSLGEKVYWTITAGPPDHARPIESEMTIIVEKTKRLLRGSDLAATDIIFATILLQSMNDFGTVNKIYSSIFTQPNPPARVTVSCGSVLPQNTKVVLQLTLSPSQAAFKQALHVQSRSYWAPSNIGPYSQAIAIPLPSGESSNTSLCHIAGQIPLVPATMTLPEPTAQKPRSAFTLQAVLSLQHLWRIGRTMNSRWWTSAAAYIARDNNISPSQRARIAGSVWRARNSVGKSKTSRGEAIDEGEEDDEPDLWEAKYHAGMRELGSGHSDDAKRLPDWSTATVLHDVEVKDTLGQEAWDGIPPFFAVEVKELPRASSIEWHAHLGITSNSIKLHAPLVSSYGIVYQTTISNTVTQTTAFLRHSPSASLESVVKDLFAPLGFSSQSTRCVAAYIDVAKHPIYQWDCLDDLVEGSSQRTIPTFSLWDEHGAKLAGVWVLETDIRDQKAPPSDK